MSFSARDNVTPALERHASRAVSAGDFPRIGGRAAELAAIDPILGVRLGAEGFNVIDLTVERVLEQMVLFVDGRIPFPEFAEWAQELHRILARGADWSCRRIDDPLQDVLGLLALFTDVGIAEGSARSRRLVADLCRALAREARFSCEIFIRRLLRGKRAVNFVTLQFEASRRERGAPANATPGGRVRLAIPARHRTPAGLADDAPYWFAPIDVYTRLGWRENGLVAPCFHPENDKMHALREKYPALERGGLDAQYFVDPRGVATIVLNTMEIDPESTCAAARLFSLRNRLRRTLLNGELVYLPTEGS
ncbi:MAG: hypothetical protein L0Z55_02225 [Planctomycetes bacterium]|nr:hypothetical protein [Planctomycetota bacterium]